MPLEVSVRIGKKYFYKTNDGDFSGVLTGIAMGVDNYTTILTFGENDVVSEKQLRDIYQVPELDDEQLGRVRKLICEMSVFGKPYDIGLSECKMRELLTILDLPLRTVTNNWNE